MKAMLFDKSAVEHKLRCILAKINPDLLNGPVLPSTRKNYLTSTHYRTAAPQKENDGCFIHRIRNELEYESDARNADFWKNEALFFRSALAHGGEIRNLYDA